MQIQRSTVDRQERLIRINGETRTRHERERERERRERKKERERDRWQTVQSARLPRPARTLMPRPRARRKFALYRQNGHTKHENRE